MTLTLQQFQNNLEADQQLEAAANWSTIERIIKLRDTHDVLILGHNYMSPLVYNLSPPEARGDSLALARYAAKTNSPTILFDGVVFMAETAKILNPNKRVLIASKNAGCSLADPIRRKQVRQLKRIYPRRPVVTYINSYAEVKAESDIVCTSANALEVVRHMAQTTGSQEIIFLPDSLMGKNLQSELDAEDSDVKLIYPGRDNDVPEGKCEVHEQFTVDDLHNIRSQYDIPKDDPKRGILAHWECPPDVVAEADFYGSTSEMARWIRETNPERVYLATECEMAANLASEYPDTEFVRACVIFCSHMQQITLNGIRSALESFDSDNFEINVQENTRRAAYEPIRRMLELTS